MERWIVADSILSIGGAGRKQKVGGGSNALRQTSFLSSEAQWSQRAARQQGADNVEVERGEVDVIGTSGDDGQCEVKGKAISFGRNGRTRKRKRRGGPEDPPTGAGRPISSRSSTSGQSSRKRFRRHQSPSNPSDLFSDDSEGGGQDGDGEGADDDDDFQEGDDDDEFLV